MDQMQWHCVKFLTARLSEMESNLIDAGIPVFFPLRFERERVGRQVLWHVRPWFGNYGFVQLCHDDEESLFQQMALVRGARGMVDFLKDSHGLPARVPNGAIRRIRADAARFHADQDVPASRRRKTAVIPAGTPVQIVSGPWDGHNGEYVMALGCGMAMLAVEGMGQSIALQLPDCDFRCVTEAADAGTVPAKKVAVAA